MPEHPIPWDIYEEHLDEAAYLWECWEEALSAWDYTLNDVAMGPEERLIAHLDALVIGGSRVAEDLCRPALESDEPARVAAAAWVLLHDAERDRWDDSWQVLTTADPARRDAMARALALSHRVDLPARLSARFDRLPPAQKACLIDVLRIRDPGSLGNLRLSRLAGKPEPELLGAILRAARCIELDLERSALDRGLASELPETRSAAIELGTLLHRDVTRSRCRSAIAEGAPELRLALAALAIGGERQDLQRLLDWSTTDIGEDALWALGFTGHPAVAEALLEAIEDPRRAPSAAESFATIVGCELDGDFVDPAPPLEPDEIADSEPLRKPASGDDLPMPNAPVVRGWWKNNARRFEADRRYYRGEPWRPALPVSQLPGTATWRLRGARLGLPYSQASLLELRGWARNARFPTD